jgi:hypothetical protein
MSFRKIVFGVAKLEAIEAGQSWGSILLLNTFKVTLV